MEVRELSASPREGTLFTRAVLGAVRFGGDRREDRLPEVELRLSDVTVERDRLAAYDRVCGFRIGDRLPATYPHILAFPVALQLMTDPAFPFPVLGLVHIRNQIRQRRPIDVTESLTLAAWAENLRPHRRGRQVDVVVEARVGEELVWSDVSTHLAQAGGSIEEGRTSGPTQRTEGPELAATALWEVPGDVGRRYASVSGDRNPIHLSSVGARLFGFKRAIAHGMWTAARCLAALEGRLPDGFAYDVEFKRPLLLPSRVSFAVAGRDAALTVEVRDARTHQPHLLGTISPS